MVKSRISYMRHRRRNRAFSRRVLLQEIKKEL